MKHLPPEKDSCLALPAVQVLGAFQRTRHLAVASADTNGLRLQISGAPGCLSLLSNPNHLRGGGSETILLVDDNSAIRSVAQRIQGLDHRYIPLLLKPFSPAHV
jgi:hypothetical protein